MVRLPQQELTGEQVLIQVQAVALSATEVALCAGLLGDEPCVPGVFFTGKVERLGQLVRGLRVGELVLGLKPEAGCYCESLCGGLRCFLVRDFNYQ